MQSATREACLLLLLHILRLKGIAPAFPLLIPFFLRQLIINDPESSSVTLSVREKTSHTS